MKKKVEKDCRAGQGPDDNMAHAHCMLDTYVCQKKNTQNMQYLLLFHSNNGFTNCVLFEV